MSRDEMIGMSLDELVSEINHQRRQAGLSAIAISTRPSSNGEGRTIEIHGGDVLFAKSVHGGALNWFLKGMFAGFSNAPAPKVRNFNADLSKIGVRAIDWRS
jgi:hypothetical protein